MFWSQIREQHLLRADVAKAGLDDTITFSIFGTDVEREYCLWYIIISMVNRISIDMVFPLRLLAVCFQSYTYKNQTPLPTR